MILRTIIFFGALIGGASAHADPVSRFGAFVGLNQSDADTVVIGSNEHPTTLGDSFSGTGYRLGATWSFSPNAAVEVGWSKFGNTNDRTASFPGAACPGGCVPPGDPIMDNVEQSGSAFWAAIVPSIEHGSMRWYGKIGGASVHVESIQTGNPGNRLKKSDTVALIGVGASYALNDRFRIRAEFERVGSVANQFGLGVEFGF